MIINGTGFNLLEEAHNAAWVTPISLALGRAPVDMFDVIRFNGAIIIMAVEVALTFKLYCFWGLKNMILLK
jgi:hypothetical protein